MIIISKTEAMAFMSYLRFRLKKGYGTGSYQASIRAASSLGHGLQQVLVYAEENTTVKMLLGSLR